MKFHPNSIILDFETGEPFKMVTHYLDASGKKFDTVKTDDLVNGIVSPVEVDFTLGKVLSLAANRMAKDPSAKVVLDRVTLLARIQNGIKNNKQIDLTSEQITEMKDLVAASIQPLRLSGLVCHALEGEVEIEGIPFLVVPKCEETQKAPTKSAKK